jgi:hypothetical protein
MILYGRGAIMKKVCRTFKKLKEKKEKIVALETEAMTESQ